LYTEQKTKVYATNMMSNKLAKTYRFSKSSYTIKSFADVYAEDPAYKEEEQTMLS